MKTIYLILAIIGALVPYAFFLDFFSTEGWLLETFIGGLFVNGAAGGFAADVLLSSLVFWVYLFNAREKGLWVYIAINLTIGLSCALPCYLYIRQRRIESTVAP